MLSEDQSVILRNVKRRACFAEHLLELVLVLALVHVLLSSEVRHDLVRDDEVDLVTVEAVATEHEVDDLVLCARQHGIHQARAVHVHIS